jgi:hypothetical protein
MKQTGASRAGAIRRARVPRPHPSSSAALQAEHFLDFVPDREDEEDRERHEERERDDEAEACARLLPPPANAGVTPCAVIVIRAADRLGIDRGIVARLSATGGLCHCGILVSPRPVV